jgi:hypothetical protein
MTKKTVTSAIAVAALTCAGSLQAHHSSGMFDERTAVWVKGTVVRYDMINPHALLLLEHRDKDGRVQRWSVEGPDLKRLDRMGIGKDFLKAGDVIEVCGFAFRTEPENRRPRPSLHGNLVVMPDGKMRSWGPYGKIENCIRPNDRPQAWLDFVNADPMAHRAWCRGRALVTVETTSSKSFVEEIERRMATPCPAWVSAPDRHEIGLMQRIAGPMQ